MIRSVVVSVVCLWACGDRATEASRTAVAESIGAHECEVCRMTVREQPAPRGQLLYRDGTRMFFCSLSDLATHQVAPSPHGEAVGVFVEVLQPGTRAEDLSSGNHPWKPAAEAWFVVGNFQRPVMGRPVLAFAQQADAEAARQEVHGQVLRWPALVSLITDLSL